MNKDELRAILTAGIDAARNNNPILARQSFRQVLAEDPDNELAWMWLAQVVDLDDQRREALQNVLRINPDNDRARDALRRLGDDVPDPNQVQSRLSQALDSSSAAAPPPQAASSASSQKPVFVPKKTDQRNQPRELWASNRRGSNNNRTMFMLLMVLAGVLLIIAGLVIAITQIVDTPAEETNTPTEPVVADVNNVPAPTNTPSGPTATFVVILETATPPSTLLPTAIPSETPIPTETPIPSPPDDDLALIFVSDAGLASIRGDGSSERNLNVSLGGDGGSLGINQAALSADGDSLVFSATTNGTQDIYRASANGSNVEKLTNLSANQTIDPAWSPDGEFIAFASDANGNLDIYVVSANGGIPRRVTSTPDDERQPVWSPDGKYLVYAVSPTTLDTEIFVVEIGEISNLSQPLVEDNTSNDACQITRAPRLSFAPSFSPDGKHIAFLSNRDSATDIDVYIMNSDGSGVSLVSANDGLSQEQSVSWSPDGRWLAVTSSRNAAVINDSGFTNAGDTSSDAIEEPTATTVVEASPTDDVTDETADEATAETTDENTEAQDEPTLVPTVAPTTAPTASEDTTLWLYDIQAKLWYQVTDETATNVFWQSSGADVEVAEDIKFNCMQ